MLLFGMWLRATFVGLALVGAGIAALFDPPTTVSALMALTWIAAGSARAGSQRTALPRRSSGWIRMDRVPRPASLHFGCAASSAPARRP
jgi:hypothetical protein